MISVDMITACKLYKTSPRRDAILRKINASSDLNIKLKIQKPGDVDESSLPEVKIDVEDGAEADGGVADGGPADADAVRVDRGGDDDGGKTLEERRPFRRDPSEHRAEQPQQQVGQDEVREREDLTDAVDEGGAASDGAASQQGGSDAAPAPSAGIAPQSAPIAEATAVNSSLERTYVQDNMYFEVEDIKGQLNSRGDTCGVNRVAVKNENELWIYYNDSVNLNNVMGNVIEELNRPGYTYLEFNRLARSDNAMVFIILSEDTEYHKKPIVEMQGKAAGAEG